MLAFDKRSGELLWQRTAFEGTPAVKRHTKASHTNSTPATDGNVLVVFLGSEGLHAFDLDGKPLWRRQFGLLDSGFYMVKTAQWGFASSPVIHDGRVIIQVDVQGDSFLASLDSATGEDVWRTDRDEIPTWSSPAVFPRGDGGRQVVVNGYKHIGGYDFDTGEELWRLEGGGHIYFSSEDGDVYAIEPGAELNEIAVNELGETLMATPAISAGVIYFRARRHLIAVGAGS